MKILSTGFRPAVREKLPSFKAETTPSDSETTPSDSETTPSDSEITPSDSEITPSDSEITPPDSETTKISKAAKSALNVISKLVAGFCIGLTIGSQVNKCSDNRSRDEYIQDLKEDLSKDDFKLVEDYAKSNGNTFAAWKLGEEALMLKQDRQDAQKLWSEQLEAQIEAFEKQIENKK